MGATARRVEGPRGLHFHGTGTGPGPRLEGDDAMSSSTSNLALLGAGVLVGVVISVRGTGGGALPPPVVAIAAPDRSPTSATTVVPPRAAVPLLLPTPTTPAPTPRGDREVERQEFTTEEIVTRCEGAVAVIHSEKGIGTGFLVRRGVLVTNAHVIEGAPIARLRVAFPSSPSRARDATVKELLFEDPGRDLALLRVETTRAPLSLETSYRFRRGQEVTVIGSPGTTTGDILENAVSRGVMSTSITHRAQPFYQMSIAINPGNSGGPVIGSEGRVVGVATLKDVAREGIAFCIPVDEVTAALGRMDAAPPGAAACVHALGAARALNAKFDAVATVYENTLGSIAGLVDDGRSRGVDPSRALILAEQAFRKKYGENLHKFTAATLYPDVCRTVADRDLPRQVVVDLSALWQVLLDLQKHAEQPRGESDVLRGACQTLRERHQSLFASLRRSAGSVASEEPSPGARRPETRPSPFLAP
jgi:S1-C subfamily serine protease